MKKLRQLPIRGRVVWPAMELLLTKNRYLLSRWTDRQMELEKIKPEFYKQNSPEKKEKPKEKNEKALCS